MRKRSQSVAAMDADERFLLQALQRLRTPEQRYVFTLIADLISSGLAAQTFSSNKAK